MEKVNAHDYIYVAIWIIGVVFGAGVAWGAATVQNRRTRKDLNGVGSKLNGIGEKLAALERDVRDRYTTQTIAVMAVASSAEDRELTMHVGEILNDPARGK